LKGETFDGGEAGKEAYVLGNDETNKKIHQLIIDDSSAARRQLTLTPFVVRTSTCGELFSLFLPLRFAPSSERESKRRTTEGTKVGFLSSSSEKKKEKQKPLAP
jgi:hypothetical protein